MIGESFAIIAVILVMAAMYLRAGKVQLTGLTLPLTCLPAAHLIGAAFRYAPRSGAGVGQDFIFRCCILVAGALVGIGLSLYLSRKMTSRRGRIGYLSLSFVFTGALALAYVLYML